MNDLKYNIEKFLNEMPYDKRNTVLKELETVTGLSYVRLHQIRNLKKNDTGEMKVKHLVIIAKFFNVALEEIINEEVYIAC